MLKFYVFLSLTLIFTSAFILHSNKDLPEVYLASYKNDAEAAYTLIHDDYGGHWASGIEDYADTMAYKRSIPFCFAIISSQCSEADWKKAKEMVLRGHQAVNHSMYHKCGKETDWCQAGHWGPEDFPIEIDSTTSLITKHTGNHPAFFVFPFDLHTDTMINYLKTKGYAGARAGIVGTLEEINTQEPFHLNFKAFSTDDDPSDLNEFANQAVANNGWAIREVHGVEDGSWGAISLNEYEKHLNYISSLALQNKLWIGTLSDIVLYKKLKDRYSKIISELDEKENILTIELKKKKGNYTKQEIEAYNSVYKTSKLRDLTIVINNFPKKIKNVIQKGNKIPFRLNEEKIILEADPTAGPIIIKYH